MSKIETTSKVSLKLTSKIKLEGGACAPQAFVFKHSPQDLPQPGKGNPIPKMTHSPHRNHQQNRNHKQSATEAQQQHKPRKARSARTPEPPTPDTAPETPTARKGPFPQELLTTPHRPCPK